MARGSRGAKAPPPPRARIAAAHFSSCTSQQSQRTADMGAEVDERRISRIAAPHSASCARTTKARDVNTKDLALATKVPHGDIARLLMVPLWPLSAATCPRFFPSLAPHHNACANNTQCVCQPTPHRLHTVPTHSMRAPLTLCTPPCAASSLRVCGCSCGGLSHLLQHSLYAHHEHTLCFALGEVLNSHLRRPRQQDSKTAKKECVAGSINTS